VVITQNALTFAQETQFRGPIENATHYGVGGSPGGGPHFQLWLIVENGRVARAAYQTHGCPASMGLGGKLCAILTGREADKVKNLTRDDIVTIIGPLPEGKEFNYGLAATAVQTALEN